MLPAKFGSIWPRSFRGGDLFSIRQSETRIALGSHICILFSDWLMLNKSSPLKLLGQMEPNLAGSIYVRYSIKLLHGWPCLLAKWNHMKKLYRVSYIDASCQVWFHLAKEFQRRRFV
jgi:hypothetical protein